MKTVKILLTIAFILLLLFLTIYFITGTFQEQNLLNEESRKKAPGKFITLSDGVTHYQLMGPENGRPLIFIHGGGIAGIEVWKHNASYFAEQGYRVLLYDLYGRGYSDRLDREYTPDLFLSQLNEITEALDFKDSLSIISMSMGSIIAIDYAIEHGPSVKKMVFVDPAISGDFRANRLLKVPIVSDFLMTLYWYPRAVENQRKEFVDPQIFEEYSEQLKYFMEFKGYKHVNYSTWMNMLNQNRFHLLSEIPIEQMMLIYGSQDPYFQSVNAKRFIQAFPDLQIHKIDKTGHMPHMEKPTETNLILAEFLKLNTQ